MGRYDFTTRPDRLNQFTYKWKTSENNPELLQMWVADMDFCLYQKLKKLLLIMDENIFLVITILTMTSIKRLLIGKKGA